MNSVIRRLTLPAALLALAVTAGASPSYAGSVTATTPTEQAPAASTVHARATAITLSAPREVTSGATIGFTGKLVTKQRPRRVQVAERAGGRWVVVGQARTKRSGAYQVSVPAGTAAGRRVFRAQAARSGTLPAVRTGRLSVRVLAGGGTGGTGGPSGSGSASDWTYLMDGGSRWNPCETITWSYNSSGQAYDALADVTAAFTKIAKASGLTFEYAGPSPLVYLGLPGVLSGGADITVGWANASQLPVLVDSVVGIGGALGTKVTGHDVTWKLTTGWVTLDNNDPLSPKAGFGASSFGQVLLHETLHVLGLGHAAQPDQLMYPVASGRNTAFGAGDLAGIAAVGAGAGCL